MNGWARGLKLELQDVLRDPTNVWMISKDQGHLRSVNCSLLHILVQTVELCNNGEEE